MRIQSPDADGDQEEEDDDVVDEESEATEQLLIKTPRSKLKRKNFRAASKIKRSIYKETISTKVKKQEKFTVQSSENELP